MKVMAVNACPRMGRKNCNHRFSRKHHAFVWPENLPDTHPKYQACPDSRDVWNPLHPVCAKCGRTIGELLGFWDSEGKRR